ncbi:hypothetical protein LQ764DRAFT_115001 [Zygosaccharomyces rouxii]|nr:hypothetical protein LQ764DRAFT_115001 [Zygosaccharomyces rouxii]
MLCKKLYQVLSSDSTTKTCRLTFAPNQPDINDPFFISEEPKNIEIVCFKNTYLSIFKEAHDYFQNYPSISASPKDWNTYYSSLGYLLTTPENKTNFNVHYDTFLKMWEIDDSKELLNRELKIVQRLLTSSNNRLNKSSSLWQMYRKLYTLSMDYNNGTNHNYIFTFLESGSKHLSNYYCWNASRWFFDVFPINEKKLMIDNVKQFCFKNFKDSSSWDALAYMLCQQRKKIGYNIKNYYHPNEPDQREHQWLEFEVDEIFAEIIHLIDSFAVTELPPFLCCRTIAVSFPELKVITKVLKKWRSDIQKFEQQYGPLQFIRNNPIPASKYTDDIIISGLSRHIGYKKRFVEQNL